MDWFVRDFDFSLLLQSLQPVKPVVSEMPFPGVDRLAVSGLRIDTRLLSTAAYASGGSIQTESAVRPDLAVYRLRLSGLHEGRHHRQASSPRIYPLALPLGLVGVDALFLGFPQHAVVSVRVVTVRIHF